MSAQPVSPAPPAWFVDFADRSEMGALVVAHDWSSSTSLGHPSTWQAGLRLAVSICLSSQFPMMVVWGPDLVKIYNDAYRPILGAEKHPAALGAPAREVWPEIWDTIGPLFAEVLDGGSTWHEHQFLALERNGFLEECFFTYSYSPLPDDDGGIGGVIDIVTETTGQVVNGRRLECISALAADLVSATDVTEVCRRTVASLRAWGDDVAAAEIHLEAGGRIVRVATSRRAAADAVSETDLRRVLAGHDAVLLDEGWVPGRPAHRWAGSIGSDAAPGILVVDLSPYRPYDEAYRTYLELIARTVGAAIEHAHNQSAELGEQRRISDALQSAMLQPVSDLPTVAARYLPATGNLSVGGDWYDVVTLGDGRRALVVGDCVGHGLEAAIAMGQLRTASRTLLIDGNGPAEVLEAMDRFAASVPGAACATMVCSIVDLGARTITYATAGHPAALLVGKDGTTWLSECAGMPLAIDVVDGQRSQAVATFEPDDLLVLYTDGLVERRDEDIDTGFERLRVAATSRRDQSVQELADGLLGDLLDPEGRDDVALVVKRLAARVG
ncbi:MAG: SpoIIE family protein phosphatase [Acidimicrobiales bacterium]|nr:SpoIIE family protein phosphatase [Acidimicrobiales bacterium]